MIDAIPFVCAPEVPPALVRRLVQVESSANPFAIGVVGARLARQPASLPEAVATARHLEALGMNYSIGITQVNRVHFARLGWDLALHAGFDSCGNLRAGAAILSACFARARRSGYSGRALDLGNPATRAALSCYYSGSLSAGERLGYVARVVGAPRGGSRDAALPVLPSMFD